MKRLIATALVIVSLVSPCFAHKAVKVEVKLHADKILVYNKATNRVDQLDWYLTKEDIKSFKGAKWFYDYEEDILYRLQDGILYNMNEED